MFTNWKFTCDNSFGTGVSDLVSSQFRDTLKGHHCRKSLYISSLLILVLCMKKKVISIQLNSAIQHYGITIKLYPSLLCLVCRHNLF